MNRLMPSAMQSIMRCFLAVMLLCCNTLALALPAQDVPLDNAVVDLADVIHPQAQEKLEAQLRELHQRGEMQAAVVTVPSTDGVDPFTYGMALAKRWQLGDAQKNNGLLMLVAVNDRNIRIFPGYGLEGDLPDITLNRIIRDTITPHFKHDNYAEGISAGFAAMARVLNGEGLPPPVGEQGSGQGDDEDTGLGFIVILLLFVMNGISRLSRQFGKLQTWLVLSGGIAVAIGSVIGWTLTAVVCMIISSVLLLVAIFFFGMLPKTSGSAHRSGGFIGSSGGSWSGHSSGGSSSYRGGGGSFGGGGAGGSW